jgi:hypothetical protein
MALTNYLKDATGNNNLANTYLGATGTMSVAKPFVTGNKPVTSSDIPTEMELDDFSSPEPVIPEMPTVDEVEKDGQLKISDVAKNQVSWYDEMIKSINEPTATEQERSSLTKKLEEALAATGTKPQALADQQARLGIPEETTRLNEINRQIAQAQAGLDLGIAREEARPIARGFITGRTAEMRRQAAAEIGGLSTMAQAIQGNIELAKQTAKEVVDAQFAAEEQRIENIKTLLNVNADNLSREDKKKADELSVKLKERESIIEEEKTERKNIYDLAIKALEAGATSDVAMNIMKSSNIKEAMFNAGESLSSFAKDELLSPTEAATLGVPYGTTQKEAAAMGVIPKSVLTPQDKMDQEFKMLKQVDALVKESKKAQSQIKIMETSLGQAITADSEGKSLNPASQGILVTFQKILDPTSVVRESEYARSAEGLSLISQIQGAAEKLQQGGAGMTVKELSGFVDAAKSLVENYNNEQLDTLKRTRVQAGNWGLNLDNILSPDALTLLASDDEKRLKEYYANNKEQQAIIDKIIDENPDISNYDILRIVGQGFKSDLSKSVKGSYPTGSYGGQCTTFLHGLADFPSIGDLKQQKFNSVNKFGIKKKDWTPKVGDIIVTDESKRYGHTAMVTNILPGGELVLTESNYAEPNKVTHDRTINYNSPRIYGAIRPNKLKV